MEETEFRSIGSIRDSLNNFIEILKQNNKDPYQIPLLIKENYHKYPVSHEGVSFEKNGNVFCFLDFYESDEIKTTAPDSRPYVGGEYWQSRGPSDYDCSGFIKSKLAGERILRLVKYILEKDDIKSRLDFREYEPEYIQFKFSSKEFDISKLHQLSIENNGIINEKILRESIK